jgi:glycine cleavage system H lipoate-binding protein
MTCPFLKETQVKYCQTASVRKLIPLAVGVQASDKCSSAAHTTCSVYRRNPEPGGETGACPYLRESLMQYCGAAPVPKMIPYSESLLSRCGGSSYRYCELFLGMAHPEPERHGVDGIALPDWLRYSANHMWLDVGDDGVCHAGIDAFLCRVLGKVERISYIWQAGILRRPAAVLTAGGVDVEVVFPNPMHITNCNVYLRSDPARLTAEPYTGGWLFEGRPTHDTAANLMEGEAAREWMLEEERHMNEFLQQTSGGHYAADGGLFAAGLPGVIGRDRMLTLCHEFFLPQWGGAR